MAKWYFYLFRSLSVCVCVCLRVCLCVCLRVCVCLRYVRLSRFKLIEFFPLQLDRPHTLAHSLISIAYNQPSGPTGRYGKFLRSTYLIFGTVRNRNSLLYQERSCLTSVTITMETEQENTALAMNGLWQLFPTGGRGTSGYASCCKGVREGYENFLIL